MAIEYKNFQAEVKEFDEKDLTVVHFISSERVDRGKDILYASKNDKGAGMVMQGRVVVLFMHGWGPAGHEPIAKPVWIRPAKFKETTGIECKTQFYPDELGKRLWEKTTKGYLPNWSVGWRPVKAEVKTDGDGNEIRHVYEWELLEYSLVGVPMQPDAQTVDAGKTTFHSPLAAGHSPFAIPLSPLAPHSSPLVTESLQFKVVPCICNPSGACKGDKPCGYERFGELVAWKSAEGSWEEKPYPNEHSCRILNPDGFIRIRRQNNKFGKGIHAIWGIRSEGKPVELQAIRFSKANFTATETRKWAKDHKYKCNPFEPASEKCEVCGEEMTWKQEMEGEEIKGQYVCDLCHGDPEKAMSLSNGSNRCKCDNEKCGHQVRWRTNCDGMKCVKCGRGTMRAVKEANSQQSTDKKSKDEPDIEEKRTIPYKKTPLAPVDEKWDGKAAKQAEPTVLKVICAWMDEKNPDVKSSYKLPHHKPTGEHACVWNGVRAAAAALMGARGGAAIPSEDVPKVKNHLEKHYKDFDKGDAPWKSQDGQTFLTTTVAEGLTEEAIFKSAQKLIPDLAEFFDPSITHNDINYSRCCHGPAGRLRPREGGYDDILDQAEAQGKTEEVMADLVRAVKEIATKHGLELAYLPSDEPGADGQGKTDSRQTDNPPEPQPIRLVIKDEEAEKKRTEEAMASQVSSQITESVRRVIPEMMREVIDKLRGRVK